MWPGFIGADPIAVCRPEGQIDSHSNHASASALARADASDAWLYQGPMLRLDGAWFGSQRSAFLRTLWREPAGM